MIMSGAVSVSLSLLSYLLLTGQSSLGIISYISSMATIRSLRRVVYYYMICGYTIFSGGTTRFVNGEGSVPSSSSSSSSSSLPYLVPLVKGQVSSIPTVLIDYAREQQQQPPSYSLRGAVKAEKPSSSSSSRHVNADDDDADDADDHGKSRSGDDAIHQPITMLDPRLTAYFATITFEGGQVRR